MKVKEWAAAVRWSAKAVADGGFNDLQPRRVLDEGHVDMEDVVADGEADEKLDGEMDDDEVECLVSGLIYKVRNPFYLSLSSLSPFPPPFPICSHGILNPPPSPKPTTTANTLPTPKTQGLLKGYISRDHGIIVLNRKGEIFPGTGV